MGMKKNIKKTIITVRQLLEHFPEQIFQRTEWLVKHYTGFQKWNEGHIVGGLKSRDFFEGAVTLAKSALIIRKAIFTYEGFNFFGFPPNCQKNSLPSSVKLLITMILNGICLKDQSRHESQASLSIGQIFSTAQWRELLNQITKNGTFYIMCHHFQSTMAYQMAFHMTELCSLRTG